MLFRYKREISYCYMAWWVLIWRSKKIIKSKYIVLNDKIYTRGASYAPGLLQWTILSLRSWCLVGFFDYFLTFQMRTKPIVPLFLQFFTTASSSFSLSVMIAGTIGSSKGHFLVFENIKANARKNKENWTPRNIRQIVFKQLTVCGYY